MLECDIEGIDYCKAFSGGLGRISAKSDGDNTFVHVDFKFGDVFRQIGLVMPPEEFEAFKEAFCKDEQ